ncbi:MAG TPA: hypothetical protein VG269_10000 [Tepidisphaeraceae bacterium]|jgi:hypothetical protein|nr:hypothetical protein [Tepidisphaeraceae bacterium]
MNRLCLRHLMCCAAIPAFILAGCGPMLMPMTVPLGEEDQRHVDGMWNNMLTPVNRLDRQALFDTVMMNWLFQLGVDRLHLVSEKYLTHGKVVMEIDCDRMSPAADQFTLTVLDDRGKTLRRERYSRQDVEDTYKALSAETCPVEAMTTPSATQPATQPAAGHAALGPADRPETPEQRQHRIERERRMNAVEAATQPAALKP